MLASQILRPWASSINIATMLRLLLRPKRHTWLGTFLNKKYICDLLKEHALCHMFYAIWILYICHIVIITWFTSFSCIASLPFTNPLPWPHGIVNCLPYPHFIIFWKYQVIRVLSANSFMSIVNSDIHLLLHAVQGWHKPLWSPKQNCIWRPLGAANMVGYRQSLIIHT